MGLVKTGADFFGFTTDLYIKVGGILVKEIGEDEDGKLYSMEVQVDYYTNPDKTHHFSQKTETFKGLRLEELTLQTAYLKLKTIDEYKPFEVSQDLGPLSNF